MALIGSATFENQFEGKLKFEKRYFTEKDTSLNFDILICSHVIEHISNPKSLLKTIRHSLSNSRKSMIFFETPSVEWILKNNVIWDFFYEHCSYFSKNSLINLFLSEGFKIENISNPKNNLYLAYQNETPFLKEFKGNFDTALKSSEFIGNYFSLPNEIVNITNMYNIR